MTFCAVERTSVLAQPDKYLGQVRGLIEVRVEIGKMRYLIS